MRPRYLISSLVGSTGSPLALPHDRSRPTRTHAPAPDHTTDQHTDSAARTVGFCSSPITTEVSPTLTFRAALRVARRRGGCQSCRRGDRAALVAALSTTLVGVAAVPASAEAVHVVALAGSLEEVLTNLRNFIMGILALVATVFLTIGGVRYVLSAGDAGEVSKAKEAFKNAAFGYALAALAPLVVQILRGIVGA